MCRFARRCPAAAAGFLLVLLPRLSAATVPRLDLTHLVRSSASILHGRIVRHWSGWDPAHRFIWTHYSLEVTDTLKGDRRKTITLSEPGGIIGSTIMRIEGAPEYEDGEEVVVFLEQTPIGYWRCYGWRQGRYSVTRDADGRKRVHANLTGITFAAGARDAASAVPLTRVNGMALDEFKRLVREAAR